MQHTRQFDMVLHSGETATDVAHAFALEAEAAVTVVAIELNTSGNGHPSITYAGEPDELAKLTAYYDAPVEFSGDAMRQRPVGYEARCARCGETFNPVDETDLVHLECGGQGTLLGSWG